MLNPMYKLRYEKNLSLDKLALLSGITKRTLTKIEKGRQARLYMPTLHKIEDFFHVSGIEFEQEYIMWKEYHDNFNKKEL